MRNTKTRNIGRKSLKRLNAIPLTSSNVVGPLPGVSGWQILMAHCRLCSFQREPNNKIENRSQRLLPRVYFKTLFLLLSCVSQQIRLILLVLASQELGAGSKQTPTNIKRQCKPQDEPSDNLIDRTKWKEN